MVYTNANDRHMDGEPGYAVFAPIDKSVGLPEAADTMYWAIYTDDGRGNGNFVGYAVDEFWANRIAHALDSDGQRRG